MTCNKCNDYNASCRNHIIVNKIIKSVNELTGNKVKPADISYIKYQLLQQDNSYELSAMDDDDFNEKIMAVIGA